MSMKEQTICVLLSKNVNSIWLRLPVSSISPPRRHQHSVMAPVRLMMIAQMVESVPSD